MRFMASLGIILLGVGACARLPEIVRIDVDGSTVEFKKKPDPAPPVDPPSNGVANDAAPR